MEQVEDQIDNAEELAALESEANEAQLEAEEEQSIEEEGTDAPESESVDIEFDGESLTSDDAEEGTEQDSGLVKELRKHIKEANRERRELQRRVEAYEQQRGDAPKADDAPEIGEKPKPENFDTDEDFDVAYSKWFEGKRKAEESQRQKQEQAQREQEEWNKTMESFEKSKASLGRSKDDMDEAQEIVFKDLDINRRAVFVKYLKESAGPTLFALSKKPDVLREVSKITDPIEFAIALRDFSTKVKVNRGKATPKPERRVRGNLNAHHVTDSNLERLREQAVKSGDFSKVHAYKRKLRALQNKQ